MIRVVICGGDEYGSLSRSYSRAFSGAGCDVKIVDIERIDGALGRLMGNRYIRHFFLLFAARFVQKKWFNAVTELKPDIVFVIKGFLLHPQTLRMMRLKMPNAVLWNFNPDNPFYLKQRGTSNKWIINSIPLYDIYFIWGKWLTESLTKAGARRVLYLPLGYDPELHHPVPLNEHERKVYGSDVSFVGSYDEERAFWLRKVLEYDLKIWGNGWGKASPDLEERWQGRAAVGEELSKICQASKINLNFVREQAGDGHNMRVFEIPACGGFMLSSRTKNQLEFFEEDKEAAYFETPEELRQKIDFYLQNERARSVAARNGLDKILSSGYSYQDRANRLISIYNESTGR